jgi:glycosyltransferase involved in cell wall biosynthesis
LKKCLDKKDTFFTIIIPTRERADTLTHSIKTALSQNYENFEVLVSDNASNDCTKKIVKEIKDIRLRYINTGRRVSMSENWEFALNHVSRGWVTILGDDDAILPDALQKVNQIIIQTKTRAVRSDGCFYSWPNLLGKKYGRLGIELRDGFEIRNSHKFLQNVINGEIDYKELPMLYNGGFVCTSLISDVKKRTVSFFKSMTPDVYSAIVFSFINIRRHGLEK